MLLFRRRPVERPAEALAPSGPTVSVSVGLADLRPGLVEALGAEHSVTIDEFDRAAIAIVGPVGERGVAFLKLRHPSPVLVVVDHQHAAGPERAAAYLDAGADGYLAGPSLGEVAAFVRAVLRRSGPGLQAGSATLH